MRKPNKICLKKYIMYIIFTIFTFVILALEGVNITADADSYLSMASYREPMYPLFLVFCRIISETYALEIAVLLQNILYIWAVCYCLKSLFEYFELPFMVKCVSIMVPIGVVLFCKYIVGLEHWFINGIQSEGIAIPIWLFFASFLVQFIFTNRDKYLTLCLICAGILFNTRKQLVICFLIIAIVGILMRASKAINNSRFFKSIGIVGVAGALTLLVGPLYHLVFFGEFESYTDTNSAFLTPVAYGADREMGEEIEDEEIRKIFYQVYDRANELGYNYKYAEQGWQFGQSKIMEHYQKSFNLLAFGVLRNDIKEYVNTLGIQDEFQKDMRFDEIEGDLAFSLMPYAWKNIIPVYVNSFLYGLIYSVTKTQSFLTPIAFLLILAEVVLIIMCWKKNKKKSSILGMINLLCIVVNTVVTSFFIFPQTRYMIYNTMFFYCSLLIMFFDYLNIIQEKRNG